jgi:predicted acylesterase/phospholipase RssA
MYRSLILSGGGCRCFWQAGFLEAASDALELRPGVVGAVSAGAATACMVFAGRTRAGLDSFKAAVGGNPRNVYWLNLLRGEPMFPQARLYRDTMLALIDDDALGILRRGPDIRVMIARTPAALGPRLSLALAAVIDQAQRLFARQLHPQLARRAGFRSEVVSVRECRTPWDLAQLVLQSSCTPPFTPYYRRHGRPTLDGGLIDSVPVETVDEECGPTLVLLTRPHATSEIPPTSGRHYIWPSAPIPVAKWDYTSAGRVQATFELGLRDGERFARDWRVPA